MKNKSKKILLLVALTIFTILIFQNISYAADLDWEKLNEMGIQKYGTHEFSQGLMPVITNQGWNYINEKGEIVDLNKGRFDFVYSFREGLAGVIDSDNHKLGYIDLEGNLVIPCKFDPYFDKGVAYSGYFHKGQAPILKVSGDTEYIYDEGGVSIIYNPTYMLGKIDKKGNIIKDYEEVENIFSGVYNVIDDSGIDYFINSSSWSREFIYKARDLSLTTESVDFNLSNFKDKISREEFSELIVNLIENSIDEDIEIEDRNIFKDTENEYILKAHKLGIVNGVGQDLFAPNDLITREQVSSMIFRAIEYLETYKGEEFIKKDRKIKGYKDAKDLSPWARDSVAILVNNKIMLGTSEDKLSPKQNTSIEESIILIYRLYHMVGQEDIV